MRYQKQLDKVLSGTMSRAELVRLKQNAEKLVQEGGKDALAVLEAINNASPSDPYYVFMGFCPDADISNRLDTGWKQKGICRFDYLESEHQLVRFESVYAGDTIILKKREKFGVSMKLYGYGRVQSVEYDENDIRYLNVEWSDQEKVIEVPLMACNSTVDIKTIDQIEEAMPEEFFEWMVERSK
jgi:hypothetical protein